jgi:hypothetical protein
MRLPGALPRVELLGLLDAKGFGDALNTENLHAPVVLSSSRKVSPHDVIS